MHIAHLKAQDSIGVEELAKRTGLKRRRIALLAADGKIPGAVRLNGYHFVYPLTPELLDWIEWKRRQVQKRKQPVKRARPKLASGVITLPGMRQAFEIWFRRVNGLNGILKMESEYLRDIIGEIRPIALLHLRIAQELKNRDSINEP